MNFFFLQTAVQEFTINNYNSNYVVIGNFANRYVRRLAQYT